MNRGGLYIDSPDRIKNKQATINPVNKKKCFQYTVTVALNHEESITLNVLHVTKEKHILLMLQNIT